MLLDKNKKRSINMDLENNHIPPVKSKKPTEEGNHNDTYCFECHHEGDVIKCDSCPRAYHSRCFDLITLPERHWTCPECEVPQSSFSIINQPLPLQHHSINEFHIILKYALHRLKSHPQAEYFLKSIDYKQTPEYLDYIIHPMDFEILEKNLNLKKYSSTKAFIGDIKWILHNTFIYHGSQSKLTNIARTLLKLARHEMTEIEICSECYLRSSKPLTTDWFTKPCSLPHTLCWAKMKSYQPWPGKVLRIINNEVDVRFFGQHDRAWVSINNCFVLSKEYPGIKKKKSNINFEKSLAELQIHINQLKKLYGHFTYAPLQTLLNQTKPFKFVSIIDDSILPSYMIAANSSDTFRSSISESDLKKTDKHPNEYLYEHEQSAKRIRSSSKYTDENLSWREDHELQSTLNVFDIFNQSDQINERQFVPSKVRSSSPTDNKLQIQAFLRKYINYKPPIIDPDVRSSMNDLLDAVEAIKSISEVVTNQILEQPPRTKKPRKSNLQHRIIPKNTNSNFVTCPSLDQFLSPSSLFVPLRPLSVSPPSVGIFESIPSEINDEILTTQFTVKSEEQSSISTNSFLPIIIPNSHCTPEIPQQNIWPSILSVNSSPKRPKNRRLNNTKRSCPSRSNQNSIQTSQHVIEIPSHEDDIQTTINTFNDQFQDLMVDLTGQIDSSLKTTRMKYEKDLEEIRHSYRLSLNELHSITTEQIQEIHNSLELQYWKRLSEMRNRYESKLQLN